MNVGVKKKIDLVFVWTMICLLLVTFAFGALLFWLDSVSGGAYRMDQPVCRYIPTEKVESVQYLDNTTSVGKFVSGGSHTLVTLKDGTEILFESWIQLKPAYYLYDSASNGMYFPEIRPRYIGLREACPKPAKIMD